MAVNKRRPFVNQNSCSCAMPGVWRAVAHNPGVAVVYHAPRACTHVTGRMDLYDYYHDISTGQPSVDEYTAPLIATQIEEKHTIFGGGNLLSQCLDYVIEKYQPRYIVVANSCVSGVIGDDSEGICREKEEESGIPIINIEGRGFLDGEYYGGFFEASIALIDRFMKKSEKRSNSICILGEKGGPYSRNAIDIRSLLAGFDVKTNQRFPAYSSIEELQKVPESGWTLPLGGSTNAFRWMERLAQYMEKRLGIPYFDIDYPVGISATWEWLDALGTFIGQPERVPMAKAQMQKKLTVALEKYEPNLRGKKAVLVLGRRVTEFYPEWVLEMLDYAGVEVSAVLFLGELARKDYCELAEQWGLDNRFPVYTEQDETDCLEKADIILTTVELEGDSYRQLFLPMVPPIGIGGIIYLYEKLYRLACYQRSRGVVINGW